MEKEHFLWYNPNAADTESGKNKGNGKSTDYEETYRGKLPEAVFLEGYSFITIELE